tara:strand:+ start:42 stop:254 length:213 start_codon:yes stop_codon:yes gene_type:complete
MINYKPKYATIKLLPKEALLIQSLLEQLDVLGVKISTSALLRKFITHSFRALDLEAIEKNPSLLLKEVSS